jgi:chemotaxis protein methyltransferase CheR
LILCRYVAFTYFAPSLQQRVLTQMLEQLLPGGYLVIGTHERLPGAVPTLTPLKGAPHIFRSANHPDLENPSASPVHG